MQDQAGGIAQALGFAENFAGDSPICVILRDNIFQDDMRPEVDTLCDLVYQHLQRPIGTSRRLKTFVQDRAGHDRRYAIDASRIQGELGWKAEH